LDEDEDEDEDDEVPALVGALPLASVDPLESALALAAADVVPGADESSLHPAAPTRLRAMARAAKAAGRAGWRMAPADRIYFVRN
jgi:hypothetical protein